MKIIFYFEIQLRFYIKNPEIIAGVGYLVISELKYDTNLTTGNKITDPNFSFFIYIFYTKYFFYL